MVYRLTCFDRHLKLGLAVALTERSIEAEVETINMVQYLPISKERLEKIQQLREQDNVLQQLKFKVVQGWTEIKNQVPKART